MTVNNKLKIAILAILASQQLYAITLDPLQIQSAPGELLYAEMSFHQADANSKLEVGLATPEDLLMIGGAHQPPSHLNFFTRRNHQGEGVIVITSTRPMTNAELNIILKIQEGSAAHLKHIKQPIRKNANTTLAKTKANEKALTPKFIVSEKDIALNLPESTRFSPAITASTPTTSTPTNSQQPILKEEKVLNAPFVLPPVLNTAETQTATVTTAISTVAQSQPEQTAIAQTANTTAPAPTNTTLAKNDEVSAPDSQVIQQKEQIKNNNQTNNTAQQSKPKNATQTPATNSTTKQHIVQRNESLWSIAQRISGQTQQPLAQVMNKIKAQNQHAFIGGNANRLRQGSHLNFNLDSIPVRQNQNTNQIASQTTRPTAGKAKYRLQQAEMSLVAESNQDSSTGSAKKDTLQQKTSADLSLKVMTAREKTVTLQRNVTQLELALNQKEQRIQLLNARLAELQEQLKARQETKKSTH